MRLILKILLFPITLILSLIVSILLVFLNVGTWFLSIVSSLIMFGAIASFINGEVAIGIVAIILAFLCSPYGLPKIAGKLIVGIEAVRLAIKNI